MIIPKQNNFSKQRLEKISSNFGEVFPNIDLNIIQLYPYKGDDFLQLMDGSLILFNYEDYELNRIHDTPITNYSIHKWEQNDSVQFINEGKLYKIEVGQDCATFHPTQHEIETFCAMNGILTIPKIKTEQEVCNMLCNVLESMQLPKDMIDNWRI